MEAAAPLSPEEKALVQAARDGDSQKVRELLGKGISPDVRDPEAHLLGAEWQVTPLLMASAYGHAEVVRILLDAKADVSIESFAYKADGGPGSQALQHAVAGNHLEVAKLLMDAGANVNFCGRYGMTPLTTAVVRFDVAGVRLMLERGADVKLKPKRKDYEPPLYMAAAKINSTSSLKMRNGKMVPEISEVWERKEDVFEIFRLLIAAGADPNAPGPQNHSPLGALAWRNETPDEVRLPLIEMLMAAGGRPDVANKTGWTAISAAEYWKNPRVIEILKRPVAAPRTEPAVEEKSKKPAKAKSSKNVEARTGAEHFLDLISRGEDEYAVLAVKAPIDEVTNAFEKLAKAKKVSRDVPRKTDAREDDEIAPAAALVKVRENPWTIIVRSIYYLSEPMVGETISAAEALSKQLKTSAIALMSHSSSDFPMAQTFANGKSSGEPAELSDDAEADEFFRKQGIYLPACCVKSKAKGAWLTVEKASAGAIERADLIEW